MSHRPHDAMGPVPAPAPPAAVCHYSSVMHQVHPPTIPRRFTDCFDRRLEAANHGEGSIGCARDGFSAIGEPASSVCSSLDSQHWAI